MENSQPTLFELEKDFMDTIREGRFKFEEYLIERYQLEQKSINERDLAAIYGKLVKTRSKKHLNKDVIAFSMVLGDNLREKKGGKWLFLKRYGDFNPYFVPHILTDQEKIIDIFGKVISAVNHRAPSLVNVYALPTVANPSWSLDVLKLFNKEYYILE